MGRLLIFLFIAIPILEIWLLIRVGGQIGIGFTLLLIIATAVIGVSLVRREGLRTLTSLQERLARGEMPGGEMVEGAMLLVAGALLLTPGFFTDALGFALALPLTRIPLRYFLVKNLTNNLNIHSAGGNGAGFSAGGFQGFAKEGFDGFPGENQDGFHKQEFHEREFNMESQEPTLTEAPPPGGGRGSHKQGGNTVEGEFRRDGE
ncbi:MAG: FxsA family protein [Magnetococcales bacterium]|nr:FxsA family protein [Magnetococcales bacterium]